MNLLGNAVEYNRTGGKSHAKGRILNESTLTVSVSDTGRGIAQTDLSRIFEPFYRGSTHFGNETPDKVHFGLGLHLVDSHVKALGGECRIESHSTSEQPSASFFRRAKTTAARPIRFGRRLHIFTQFRGRNG